MKDMKKADGIRAVRRSDEAVLNCPFPAILHKKFPKCVSIPGILLSKEYHLLCRWCKKVILMRRKRKPPMIEL